MPDTGRRRALARRALVVSIGVLAITTGSWATAQVLPWLRRDRSPVRELGPGIAAITVCLLAVVGGTVLIICSARFLHGRRIAAAILVGSIVIASALAAPHWYPNSTTATVVARDPATGAVLWKQELPATQLFGITAADTKMIEVNGRIDSDDCTFVFALIRIDLDTGKILSIEMQTSTIYPGALTTTTIPPPSQPQLEFRDGSRHIFCED